MLVSRIHRRKSAGKPMPQNTARAEVNLVLATIAYNFDRLVFHERARTMGRLRPNLGKSAPIAARGTRAGTQMHHITNLNPATRRQTRITFQAEGRFAGIVLFVPHMNLFVPHMKGTLREKRNSSIFQKICVGS